MDAVIGFRIAPSQCHTCRTSNTQTWAIDTRLEDPGVVVRRNVYICEHCVAAMAKMLEPHTGWVVVSKERASQLDQVVAERDAALVLAAKHEGTLRELASMLPAAEVPA